MCGVRERWDMCQWWEWEKVGCLEGVLSYVIPMVWVPESDHSLSRIISGELHSLKMICYVILSTLLVLACCGGKGTMGRAWGHMVLSLPLA